MTDDEWDERRGELRDRYRFYILNPAHSQGVEYSLWVQEGEVEYPVIQSNTGGFVTFNSRHKTVGDGIKPTENFVDLLGIAFHEAMCFMPPVYFGNQFEDTYLSLYDGKPRNYEVWAANVLLDYFIHGDELMPELEPLAEWASEHTEFGMPILEGESDE